MAARADVPDEKKLPVTSIDIDLWNDVECLQRYSYDASLAGVIRHALRDLIDAKADDDPKFKAALERDRIERRKLRIVKSKE